MYFVQELACSLATTSSAAFLASILAHYHVWPPTCFALQVLDPTLEVVQSIDMQAGDASNGGAITSLGFRPQPKSSTMANIVLVAKVESCLHK